MARRHLLEALRAGSALYPEAAALEQDANDALTAGRSFAAPWEPIEESRNGMRVGSHVQLLWHTHWLPAEVLEVLRARHTRRREAWPRETVRLRLWGRGLEFERTLPTDCPRLRLQAALPRAGGGAFVTAGQFVRLLACDADELGFLRATGWWPVAEVLASDPAKDSVKVTSYKVQDTRTEVYSNDDIERIDEPEFRRLRNDLLDSRDKFRPPPSSLWRGAQRISQERVMLDIWHSGVQTITVRALSFAMQIGSGALERHEVTFGPDFCDAVVAKHGPLETLPEARRVDVAEVVFSRLAAHNGVIRARPAPVVAADAAEVHLSPQLLLVRRWRLGGADFLVSVHERGSLLKVIAYDFQYTYQLIVSREEVFGMTGIVLGWLSLQRKAALAREVVERLRLEHGVLRLGGGSDSDKQKQKQAKARKAVRSEGRHLVVFVRVASASEVRVDVTDITPKGGELAPELRASSGPRSLARAAVRQLDRLKRLGKKDVVAKALAKFAGHRLRRYSFLLGAERWAGLGFGPLPWLSAHQAQQLVVALAGSVRVVQGRVRLLLPAQTVAHAGVRLPLSAAAARAWWAGAGAAERPLVLTCKLTRFATTVMAYDPLASEIFWTQRKTNPHAARTAAQALAAVVKGLRFDDGGRLSTVLPGPKPMVIGFEQHKAVGAVTGLSVSLRRARAPEAPDAGGSGGEEEDGGDGEEEEEGDELAGLQHKQRPLRTKPGRNTASGGQVQAIDGGRPRSRERRSERQRTTAKQLQRQTTPVPQPAPESAAGGGGGDGAQARPRAPHERGYRSTDDRDDWMRAFTGAAKMQRPPLRPTAEEEVWVAAEERRIREEQSSAELEATAAEETQRLIREGDELRARIREERAMAADEAAAAELARRAVAEDIRLQRLAQLEAEQAEARAREAQALADRRAQLMELALMAGEEAASHEAEARRIREQRAAAAQAEAEEQARLVLEKQEQEERAELNTWQFTARCVETGKAVFFYPGENPVGRHSMRLRDRRVSRNEAVMRISKKGAWMEVLQDCVYYLRSERRQDRVLRRGHPVRLLNGDSLWLRRNRHEFAFSITKKKQGVDEEEEDKDEEQQLAELAAQDDQYEYVWETVSEDLSDDASEYEYKDFEEFFCDTCGCDIAGNRASCTVCENFDMCARCYVEPPSDVDAKHVRTHRFLLERSANMGAADALSAVKVAEFLDESDKATAELLEERRQSTMSVMAPGRVPRLSPELSPASEVGEEAVGDGEEEHPEMDILQPSVETVETVETMSSRSSVTSMTSFTSATSGTSVTSGSLPGPLSLDEKRSPKRSPRVMGTSPSPLRRQVSKRLE